MQFDFSEPVPPVAQSQEPTAEAKQQEPAYNIQNQQLISLYDLFGLSAEERTQIKPKNSRSRRRMEIPQPKERQGRKSAKKEDERAPLDWREELMLEAAKKRKEAERQAKKTKTDPKPVYPVADARKEEQPQNLKREAEREERMKPVPFTVPEQGLPKHYKEGSLVTNDDNHIGYLRDLNGFKPMFHPLELSAQQGKRASLYIEIRDTYHHLYLNEADTLRENPALRQMLNRLYDDFTGKFGKLNDPKNLDLIKMDAGGREILSLERYREGKAVKADIFERPVAFNNREITHADNARDALAASLNKHGKVNLEYMAQLTGTAEDGLLSELKGKVYFNPLVGGYEVADKFIAGNVISKADEVQKFIDNHSDHEAAKESLAALREAAPKPIDFDDLDFNFGERWIPTGIYAAYASYLFETDVKVTYASSRDEFSLNARSRNANITEKYGVRSENRLFDGVA
ncbi:DNA methylase [Bacteroides reticulotermitis JCM 10512]|uniref:DNA methylase n=1 Tax=Bacteroides reticulotermitis JCM 10512 TaxID=1445607 RepID=W4UYX5_9BACE|nr:DNA methylase [Bacteroides reticulotermitis JCM 10512]